VQWYGGSSLRRREENDLTGASPSSFMVVERTTLELEIPTVEATLHNVNVVTDNGLRMFIQGKYGSRLSARLGSVSRRRENCRLAYSTSSQWTAEQGYRVPRAHTIIFKGCA